MGAGSKHQTIVQEMHGTVKEDTFITDFEGDELPGSCAASRHCSGTDSATVASCAEPLHRSEPQAVVLEMVETLPGACEESQAPHGQAHKAMLLRDPCAAMFAMEHRSSRRIIAQPSSTWGFSGPVVKVHNLSVLK